MAPVHQVKEMIDLQGTLNQVAAGPDWASSPDIRFPRAAWVECAELMDHVGWKWWKHQEPDVAQARMELVDIWHFGLSDIMARHILSGGHGDMEGDIARDLSAAQRNPDVQSLNRNDILDTVEQLALSSLQSESGFSTTAFAAAMNAMGMDFQDLYKSYVGKNVLNFFRQDHGYKTGQYIKSWDGREDNEHLQEIIDEAPAEDFQKTVREALEARYAQVVALSRQENADGPSEPSGP